MVSPTTHADKPVATIRLFPTRSTAAPWKATYKIHGIWASSRYWSREQAVSALTDAGYSIGNGRD